MPVPVSQLLEGKPIPVTIREDETVHQAVETLLGQDYNQLPVVDDEGCLKGIISEQTILRTYFHSRGKVTLFALTVNNCQETAATLTVDDDLIEVLDLLHDRKNYAIIIVDAEQRPVGILTHYDMTSYFRQVSEALIYVENIELTLRRYIETAFPDKESRNKAVIEAVGVDKRDPMRPYRSYGHLGFKDHINLIADKDNWPKFQGVFEPKALFEELMDQARRTRNFLAHFRGSASDIQFDGLKAALDWLATRPEPIPPPPVEKSEAEEANTPATKAVRKSTKKSASKTEANTDKATAKQSVADPAGS